MCVRNSASLPFGLLEENNCSILSWVHYMSKYLTVELKLMLATWDVHLLQAI